MNGASAYITLMEAAGFPGCETVGDFVDLVENVTDGEFDLIDEVQFKDPNVGAKVYDEIHARARARAKALWRNPTTKGSRYEQRADHNRYLAATKAEEYKNRSDKVRTDARNIMNDLRDQQHTNWKNA